MIITAHAVQRAIERYPKKFSGIKKTPSQWKFVTQAAQLAFITNEKKGDCNIRIGKGFRFVEKDGVILTTLPPKNRAK